MIPLALVRRFPWLMLPGTAQDHATLLAMAEKLDKESPMMLPRKLAPERRMYTVQLRAIRHLTRDVNVLADSASDARTQALELADRQRGLAPFHWDESAPEDVQIESTERTFSDE